MEGLLKKKKKKATKEILPEKKFKIFLYNGLGIKR